MATSMMACITTLAEALAAGRTSSVALTSAALDRIGDPDGEGARTFLHLDRDLALTQAAASDALRSRHIVPSPLAGIPISVKDLVDIQGEVTTAGSTVLQDQPPATADAPVVARLRAAGAVIIGRTNMTEFAYSGLGLNPHYGTPGNPFDRQRIPGGSSSGAAVSVADGMAAGAVGSDTGGSVRIPAAFCGLAGLKPTQRRVPRDGAVPLSWSQDSIGPLARTVSGCALLDAAMAGDPIAVPRAMPLQGLRVAVPRSYLFDDLEDAVAQAFDRALQRLSAAGAVVRDLPMPQLDRIQAINAKGGVIMAEAYAWHRALIETRGNEYDPRVRSRILRGNQQSGPEYVEAMRGRAALMAETDAATAGIDVMAVPTVAVLPPRFDALEDDADYARINLLVLRNTTAFNVLDRPALTIPCPTDGPIPAGLMLVGFRGHDRRLLSIGLSAEGVIAG